MNNEESTFQQKHEKKRQEIEKKTRESAMRHMPGFDVPASAHVIRDSAGWYRGFAKKTLYAVLGLGFCSVVLSIALYSVSTRAPETLSYLVDQDGRIVLLEPVSNPSVTETKVLKWAANKIKAIHSLSFTDYADHVGELRPDFTHQAFINYQKALLSSKTLEKVQNSRLVMYATPLEAPKIVSAKVISGVFTWVVEMKIMQHLEGGNYASSGTELIATIVIQRTSRASNLSGMVISKYLAKESTVNKG